MSYQNEFDAILQNQEDTDQPEPVKALNLKYLNAIHPVKRVVFNHQEKKGKQVSISNRISNTRQQLKRVQFQVN